MWPPSQRTPWGGGKKRGWKNLTNDTPPKKGFWTPPSYGTFFHPPHVSSALFFLYKNPRQSRSKSSFGGVQNIFGRARFSGYVFLPPYVLHPPISWLNPQALLRRTGTTPILEKTLRECAGRESLRELLREFWFLHCTSRETPFQERDFCIPKIIF